MTGIYKITSPTGKIYIGQTRNYASRMSGYKGLQCYKQTKLYNSINKHGWFSHVAELVSELPTDIDQEVLNAYEGLYYSFYKDLGFEMLNIKETGSRGKHSPETRARMSRSAQGKKHTPTSKSKISASLTGRPKSEQAIKNLEDAAYKKAIRLVSTGEVFRSITDASKKLGLSLVTVRARLKKKIFEAI